MSSGQKIQSSVERMFRIWRERKVYDNDFVQLLDQLLSGAAQSEEGGLSLPPFLSALFQRNDTRFSRSSGAIEAKVSGEVMASQPTSSVSFIEEAVDVTTPPPEPVPDFKVNMQCVNSSSLFYQLLCLITRPGFNVHCE